MRTLAALLVALPLVAAAQNAPPPEAPPASPETPAAAPPEQPAQPSPPAAPLPPPVAAPAQPSPPPPAYPPVTAWPSPQRDTWYIGFGFGSGGGTFTDDLGSHRLNEGMGSPSTVFLNFKLGVTLTPSLLLGLDLGGHVSSGSVSVLGTPYDVTRSITNLDAMFTWFPVERGLFLRGGLGITTMRVEFKGNGSSDFDGGNITIGGGYAFWFGRSFNLTLNLDFSAQSYRSSQFGAPSRSNYTAFWIGFDWY